MKELELNPPYQFHHCKVGEVTNITIQLKKNNNKKHQLQQQQNRLNLNNKDNKLKQQNTFPGQNLQRRELSHENITSQLFVTLNLFDTGIIANLTVYWPG